MKLKKHIKRRFNTLMPKDKVLIKGNVKELNLNDGFEKIRVKEVNGKYSYMLSDKNELIESFIHNVYGKMYLIPIPDPSLVFFAYAQDNLKEVEANKREMLKKCIVINDNFNKDTMNEGGITEIYRFLSGSSSFIIFLFASIESFVNKMIPEEYSYIKAVSNKTESYNKDQIQKFIGFDEKVKKVLFEICKKDFFKLEPVQSSAIFSLKNLRDEIVHTKDKGHKMSYDELFKSLIDFDYKKTLNLVASFMNHYKKNHIIECDCKDNSF